MSVSTLHLSLPALAIVAYLVSMATVVVPGPITIVASRLAMSRHIAAAVWFLIGVTVLDIVLFVLLVSGAGPVLRAIGALPAVEIGGGLVLLWGGLRSLRSPPEVEQEPADRALPGSASAATHFTLGVLVSAGNPHYWIWWVTAGLAFVEAARPYGMPGLSWLLAALVGGVASWYAWLLWALHRGKRHLGPRVRVVVARLISVALVGLGLALLTTGLLRLR